MIGWLIVGFIGGGIFGVLLMSIIIVGKNAEEIERQLTQPETKEGEDE